MDITTLENWLWEAACSIRGPLDAPKYKDYILPLLFYKRLSDVYEHIQQIYEIYRDWRAVDRVSAIITTQEVARNDYNLSPSRYVASDDVEPPLPLEEALVLLAQAEEERAEADAELDQVLSELGFEGWKHG